MTRSVLTPAPPAALRRRSPAFAPFRFGAPRGAVLLLLLAAVSLAGCDRGGEKASPAAGAHPRAGEAGSAGADSTPGVSPNARPELVALMRQDLATERGPADGAGRAWLAADDAIDLPAALEAPPPPPDAPAPRVHVATPGTWTVIYEAETLGVAVGGMVYLQVSPFWGWSTPQVSQAHAPGYTVVETNAAGVVLRPRTLDAQLLGVEIAGRELRAGERVAIRYGAGSAGAMADTYAERGSHFWVAVDGDGDGVRAIIPDCPSVDVLPGPAAIFLLILPTTARPGETVRLTMAFLDDRGNAGGPVEGDVVFTEVPPGLELPHRVTLRASDRGRKTIPLRVTRAGVARLHAVGPAGLSAESNPLVVEEGIERVRWGDLHMHSNFSDGTGLPEDVLRYARDVAALDVACLTDHDHWGMRFLDSHPEMWEEIRRAAHEFHQPGRFVTFLGFEWTNWMHGHRHVLYRNDDARLLSSIDTTLDEPRELWAALQAGEAVTIAHHSAGEPVATNWNVAPDPRFEPVTEVVSVHGSSEAADCPLLLPNPVAGNFVRDALDRGYRLGFVGSGDSHDGHPGLAQLNARTGGLAALLCEDLTRDGVFAALHARRTYATSGPRIYLHAALAGHGQGEAFPAPQGAQTLRVRAVTPGEVQRVEVIRSGKVVETRPARRARELEYEFPLDDLRAGEYIYLRLVQEDGGMAWSSPFFLE